MSTQRGSDQHTPRVDEQLEHEVAALVNGGDEGRTEARRQEAGGDGEDTVVYRPEGETAPGTALPESELDRREELARSLTPGLFPATGEALAGAAREAFASAWIVDALRQLPDGRVYQTVAEIWEDLGHDNEPPRA